MNRLATPKEVGVVLLKVMDWPGIVVVYCR